MSNRIKVCLVGAGGWGQQHARILSLRKDIDFCGIAGRTPEKTMARARGFAARGYTSIPEMLKIEKPGSDLRLPAQSASF